MEKERHKYRSWTDEEDSIVKDVVFEKVKNGETQLIAFEELGEKLDRSPSSIAFRWNSKLRKLYKDEFKKAKELRKLSGSNALDKKEVGVFTNSSSKKLRLPKGKQQNKVTLSYDDVIAFIEEKRNLDEKYDTLLAEHQELKEKFQNVIEVVNKIK
ncbi:hypothetical protein AAGG74_15475 [Bacillus mexicanus]|uniref:hypothetical protein n=1 Tax=Bacillus mexicanus TaxID=2834415 RepID=UPI003D22B018